MRGNVRVMEVLRRLQGLFPLTARGLLVAAMAASALVFVAYESLDFVVLVFAYAALGLVALGALSVALGAILVRRRLEAPAGEARLLTDRFLPTEFASPVLRRVPLLEVDAELVEPRFERREEAGRELVRATHRGVFDEATRRITVRDAFGLAEVSFSLRGGGLFALPHLGALEPTVALLSASLGDATAHPRGAPDGDRIEMRRYVPGDPARFIHWKVYARSGELVVRMPEHAITRADRVAVYLVAGEEDEASAALMLAIARASDLESRVILGCDGSDGPLRSVEDAERAVARSKAHRGPTGLGDFVRRVESEGPAALAVIVPARPGAWLSATRDVMRGRPGGAKVFVGIDGMGEDEPSFLRRIMFKRERATRAPSKEAIGQVFAAFREVGSDVALVDRVSGRALDGLPGRRRAA